MTDMTPERAVDLDELVGDQPAGSDGLDAVDEQLIARLAGRARAGGLQLTGEGGLLAQLTKRLVESALEGEITDHLGYDRHDAAGRDGGNSRNGHRAKTVLTEVGPVEIDVPRDRDGSFEPKIVAKRKRRLCGVDELVISLSAKGLTTGEVQAHLGEVYGAEVSRQTISTITDKVVEGMAEWQNRPLDPGRFPGVVANYLMSTVLSDRLMTSRGVASPRTSRGRLLSSRATARRSPAV
jgi:putative transposase